MRTFSRLRSLVSMLLVLAMISMSIMAVQTVAVSTAAGETKAAAGGPVLDAMSALRTARLRDEQVEVVGQRTETSTTWANPDGSFRTQFAAGPVWAKKDGQWLAVDPTLRVDREGVRPKATGWQAKFARAGGTREQVTTLVSAEVDGRAVEVGWPGAVPEPRVDGAKATYPDVRPDTDLVVESRRSGFEQYFVLKKRPAGPVSFSVPITARGLKTVRTSPGGMVEFVDGAGAVIATMPQPHMWGAERDERLGEPTRSAPVAYDVNQSGDTVTVTLRPDEGFLADPAVTYPVTVDPYLVFRTTFDTYIDTIQGNTAKHTQIDLQSGTNGNKIARSLLNFDVGPIRGANIEFARVIVWNDSSYVCEPRPVELWSTSGPANANTVWANRPTLGQRYDVKVESHHHNACGGSAWIHFDATGLVKSWLATPNNLHSALIKAGDETNIKDWKKFQSADAASAWPRLDVSYTWPLRLSRPAVTPSTAPEANPTWTRSTKPTLAAWLEDDDDVADDVTFEVQDAGGAAVTSGTVRATAPNTTVSWQVPTPLTAGTAYRFRARAAKNGVEAASAWLTFTPDFVAPVAPTVISTSYPEGQWAGGAGTAGSFTITPPAADVSWVVWRLDDGLLQEAPNSGTAHTITVTPESDGKHTLTAWARDAAGNDSAPKIYTFYAGVGAVSSPDTGARTARRVQLSAQARDGLTTATYAYRRGDADTWKQVPATDVRRKSDGSPITWPAPITTDLVWDVTHTLVEDGTIQIRVEFTDTMWSESVQLVVDRDADGAATQQFGPGTLNLLTGDFALSADDASVFGVGISRTFSSREPLAGGDQEGLVALFGPAWTAGGVSTTTTGKYTILRKTSDTSVEVVRTDDSSVGFTRNADGTWAPQPDAGALTLTLDTATDRYTLRDTEGRSTVFAKAGANVTSYAVRSTFPATANGETVFVYDTVVGTDRKSRARLRKMIAPTSAVESLGACDVDNPTTSLPKGCRVLELVHAPRTTANAGSLGDYVGQVSQIKLWESEDVVKETGLSLYSYDTLGRLREVWDPRITPALKTRYEYDSGRIVKFTSPGELPWTFSYGRAGNDDTAADGMLLAATRPTLKQGSKSETESSATTTVVYDVPLSGGEAPHAMAEPAVAAWGQTDAPSDATAIFPPDQVAPAHTGRGNLGGGDYRRATVHYLNLNGRLVNEARPGGYVTTTEHDRFGNTVRQLSAANRALALGHGDRAVERLTALGIIGRSAADRAAVLSTATVFDASGQRKTDEFGPLHVIRLEGGVPASAGQPALAPGSRVAARKHKAQFFDEGRPADGAAKVENQVTRTVTGATVLGYPVDGDQRTTTTQYDWEKGLESRTVQDPGGLALAKTTTHDAQGRIVESTLPASNGNDAAATVTTYYSGTGNGPCGGKPEWAGMICQLIPKAAITGGGANPAEAITKTHTYTRTGLLEQVVESANGQSRTTKSTFDAAGRKVKTAVSGGIGEPVPDVTTEYDPLSGRQTRLSSSDGSVTATEYDALGRVFSYTDADGGRTTYQYDALDRLVRVVDSVPSSVTYDYDTTKDPRGLLTGMTDSVAGGFTAVYSAEGALVEQTLPSGVVMKQELDELDSPVRRVYTTADGAVLLSDTAARSIHGQVTRHDGVSSQIFGYDRAGRIVAAADTAHGVCVKRGYAYDRNSNRTARTTASGAPGQPCPDSGGTVEAHAYDTGDRLVDLGYAYDALGRTTATPGGAVLGYYTNDRIRSQTAGSTRQTWTLDPSLRQRTTTVETNTGQGWTSTTVKANHYAGTEDTPEWIVENTATGAITRNVKSVDGALAATTSARGDLQLHLINLHGDVNVVHDPATSTATVLDSDEFGVPRPGQASTRYGWLGASQRSAETLGGVLQMGVRLYNPGAGRFLQVDPVKGGSANNYDYCSGDPNNCTDTSGFGNCSWHPIAWRWARTGSSRWSWGFVPSYWSRWCSVVINYSASPILIAKDRCGWIRVCSNSPVRLLWPGQSSKRYWADTDAYRRIWSWWWQPVYDKPWATIVW